MGIHLNRREVHLFGCDTNGRCKSQGEKNHFFIIASDIDYNKKTKSYVTAIPISTSTTSQFKIYWEELDKDDFDHGDITGFVVCDKPCRVNFNHILRDDIGHLRKKATIEHEAYRRIIKRITNFMCPGLKFK